MNAITADLVISTYPSLTLEGRGVILPSRTRCGASTRSAIAKYEKRGFEFSGNIPPLNDNSPSCDNVVNCPTRDRAFGDTFCLILPNTPRPIRETLDLMDEHESTLWRLGGWQCAKHALGRPVYRVVEEMSWGDARWLQYDFNKAWSNAQASNV